MIKQCLFESNTIIGVRQCSDDAAPVNAHAVLPRVLADVVSIGRIGYEIS